MYLVGTSVLSAVPRMVPRGVRDDYFLSYFLSILTLHAQLGSLLNVELNGQSREQLKGILFRSPWFMKVLPKVPEMPHIHVVLNDD